MPKNRAMTYEPSKRELLSGLVILLALAGVAISRGGSPESANAAQVSPVIQPANDRQPAGEPLNQPAGQVAVGVVASATRP